MKRWMVLLFAFALSLLLCAPSLAQQPPTPPPPPVPEAEPDRTPPPKETTVKKTHTSQHPKRKGKVPVAEPNRTPHSEKPHNKADEQQKPNPAPPPSR